jgi:DNA end-binding protein Ku
VEFVPLASVDMIHVEKTYFLGADRGGDKAYRLLSKAMSQTGRVAVGSWNARGKEQLILIRPYRDGLMLHQLYYANEVRSFDEVDDTAKVEFRDVELDLATKLIEELTTDKFAPEKYKDEYPDRVLAAVEQKVAGQEITIAPEAPRAQIIDLFDALKKTLAEGPKPPPSVLKGPKKTEPKSDDDEEAAAPKKKRAKG